MTLRDHILTVAKVYADATGRSMSRVATLVHSDGKFLTRLEAGGDVYTGTYERIMDWFVENWPNECDWPASVPRPGADRRHGERRVAERRSAERRDGEAA